MEIYCTFYLLYLLLLIYKKIIGFTLFSYLISNQFPKITYLSE